MVSSPNRHSCRGRRAASDARSKDAKGRAGRGLPSARTHTKSGAHGVRLSQNTSDNTVFSLSPAKWRRGLGRGGSFLRLALRHPTLALSPGEKEQQSRISSSAKKHLPNPVVRIPVRQATIHPLPRVRGNGTPLMSHDGEPEKLFSQSFGACSLEFPLSFEL